MKAMPAGFLVVAFLASALFALPGMAQDEGLGPLPRPTLRDDRNHGGLELEFYKETAIRLRGISSDFSVELPHDVSVDEFSFPVSLGAPKEGLTFDHLSFRSLIGWNISFDLTIARIVFEYREGGGVRSDFTVSNPSAGGPDGSGSLGWSLYDVHLGIDRPIVALKGGPLGLMAHAGFGFCDISAKPGEGAYLVDVPPLLPGKVLGKRQEFLDGYVRAGVAFSLPLWGSLDLVGDLISEWSGMQARGASRIVNFGLFVEF